MGIRIRLGNVEHDGIGTVRFFFLWLLLLLVSENDESSVIIRWFEDIAVVVAAVLSVDVFDVRVFIRMVVVVIDTFVYVFVFVYVWSAFLCRYFILDDDFDDAMIVFNFFGLVGTISDALWTLWSVVTDVAVDDAETVRDRSSRGMMITSRDG